MTTIQRGATKTSISFIFALLASITLLLILTTKTTRAASITVSSGTDTIASDSTCHLSEAIQNINDQAQTNSDCPAGDGNNDTIYLPAGTITLSGDLPDIEQSVEIIGQGASSTVIEGGGGIQKSIVVPSDSQAFNLLISGLTLKDFHNNYGSLNLTDINITPNFETATISDVVIINQESPGTENVGMRIDTGDDQNVTLNNVSIVHNELLGVLIENHGGTTTLNNVTTSNNALGIMAFTEGNYEGFLHIINSTIAHNDSSAFGVAGAAGIAVAAGGLTVDLKNTLLVNNVNNGNAVNCGSGILFGEFLLTDVTSQGGNLSGDASCNSAFTHPTDQNEVSDLSDSLGSLSDNGGSVPTIPLLEGSPAIDAGVTVAGLTTDARGVTRPQCSAYDSGAYEYNGTCPTPEEEDEAGGGNVLTTTLPTTNKPSYLVLPSGVSNASFTPTPTNTVPIDNNGLYSYPTDLVSFQFDTDVGATETITLYYDLPGNPTDYTARKYNDITKQFTTIANATITREDYNNTSMLKLTYQITDGGTLDQDNTTNGTIVDPVGLATELTEDSTVGAPNTGLIQHWLLNLND